MNYREFVYIPSEIVRENICAILAKKGWRFNFHPPIPFYLYAPEMKGNDHLGWDTVPYTDDGRYTQIGINEVLRDET